MFTNKTHSYNIVKGPDPRLWPGGAEPVVNGDDMTDNKSEAWCQVLHTGFD